MSNNSLKNNQIAKNTILLYIRTFFVMLISLYTSRVILKALGVNDYGVYQVVGGVVMMFSIISNALSSAISRFITFEIGHGNNERLRRIFSTSVIIQIGLALIVAIAVEIIAIWFIENQMQIPDGRLGAAKLVLHCSLITFCINLISIPYNACIIAHEHMKAFAYVSILEAILKLSVAFSIMILPNDRLVGYAVLLAFISLIVRVIYGLYCHRNFEETRGHIIFDKDILKEMIGFSGWNFLTSTNSLLNNQGVNMLMNVYFGVGVNAARGIAIQVENAVLQFVNNFTTAINPQITKSYANGDVSRTQELVCRGSKFSYLAMLVFAIPIISETETILNLWLVDVPKYTVIFTQLSIILGAIDCVGATGYTAIMASGRVKKYAIICAPIGFLEFILTWLFFALGSSVVWTYYLYILVKLLIFVTRTYLLKEFIGLSLVAYYKSVICPIILTTLLAIIPSLVIINVFNPSLLRLLISITIGIFSACLSSFFVGMNKGERRVVKSKIEILIKRFYKRK